MIGQLNLTNLAEEEQRYLSQVKQDDADHHSWFMLAQIYQRQRRLDDALSSYERAISIENLPEYHLKMGELLFDLSKYSKSLNHLLVASKQTDEKWQYQSDLNDLISRIYEYDSC